MPRRGKKCECAEKCVVSHDSTETDAQVLFYCVYTHIGGWCMDLGYGTLNQRRHFARINDIIVEDY